MSSLARWSPLRDTALVVIDVQEEYFSGRLPIGYRPRDDSLQRIGAAMDHATEPAYRWSSCAT